MAIKATQTLIRPKKKNIIQGLVGAKVKPIKEIAYRNTTLLVLRKFFIFLIIFGKNRIEKKVKALANKKKVETKGKPTVEAKKLDWL